MVYFVEERQEKLLEYIKSKGRVTVKELCSIFDVSATTVRNDLTVLEKNNYLKKTYGGAIYNSNKVATEPTPLEKSTFMREEKIAIAKIASQYITNGDTIAILTGNSGYELANQLQYHKNLTIVVNDLNIALLLERQKNHQIYFLGGFIRNQFHYTNSSTFEIPVLNIDKIFFSSNGLTYKEGATIPNLNLAELHRSLVLKSSEVYLMCDYSKIGKITFATIAHKEEIDYIITNKQSKNSDDIKKFQESKHTKVFFTE